MKSLQVGPLQDAVKRVPLKQVSKLQILPENIKALVPAKPLQLGGMNTAIHARGECAAFEAVTAKITPAKAGGHRARLDDLGHGLRADRLRADPRRSRCGGQGRGLAHRRSLSVAAAAKFAGRPAPR